MARPVTYEEMTRVDLGDMSRFPAAVTAAQKGLTDLTEAGMVSGVFVNGSAVFNDAGPRSDLDIIVTLPERTSEVREALRGIAQDVYTQTAVPLELSVFTNEELRGQAHPYRWTAIRWLRQQARLYPEQIVGQSPVALMWEDEQAPEIDTSLYNWMNGTAYAFEKQYMQGISFRPDDMVAHVLNAAHIVGRKALDSLQAVHFTEETAIPAMDKSSIDSGVQELLKDDYPGLWEQYRGIRTAYQSFDTIPGKVHAGEMDLTAFESVRNDTLNENLPNVVDLLRGMSRAVLLISMEHHDHPVWREIDSRALDTSSVNWDFREPFIS